MDIPDEISFHSSTISDNSLFGEGFGGVDVDEMAFPELDNSQNVKTNTSMNSTGLSIPSLSLNSSSQDVSSSASDQSSEENHGTERAGATLEVSPSKRSQNRLNSSMVNRSGNLTLSSRGKLVLEVDEKSHMQNVAKEVGPINEANNSSLPTSQKDGIINSSTVTKTKNPSLQKQKENTIQSPTSDISCDSNEYSPTKENLNSLPELTSSAAGKGKQTLSAVQLQIQKMEKAKKEAAEEEKESAKKLQKKFTPKAASISKVIENRILQSSKMVVNNSNTTLKQGKNPLINNHDTSVIGVANINNTIQVNTVTIVDSTASISENENKNSISNNKSIDESNSASTSSLTKLHAIATDSFAPEAPSPYYKNHPYSGDAIPAHMNHNNKESSDQSDCSTTKSGLPNFANVCEMNKSPTVAATLSDPPVQEKNSNIKNCASSSPQIDNNDNANISPFKNPLYDLRNKNRNKSINAAQFNNNLPCTNSGGTKIESTEEFSSRPPVPPVTQKIQNSVPTTKDKDFSAGSQTVSTKTIASELDVVDRKTILDKKPPINKSPTRPARNKQNFKESENYDSTPGGVSVKELANRFKGVKKGSPLMNPSLNENILAAEDTIQKGKKATENLLKKDSPKAERVIENENDTITKSDNVNIAKPESKTDTLISDNSNTHMEEVAETNAALGGPSHFKDNSNGLGGLGGVSTARTNRARHRTLSINSLPSISKSGPGGGQSNMNSNSSDQAPNVNVCDSVNLTINTNTLPNSTKMTAISSLPKGQTFNIYKTMDGLESPFVEEHRLKLHVIEEEKLAQTKGSEITKKCQIEDMDGNIRFPFPHTKEQQILEIERLGFELYSDLYSSWKSTLGHKENLLNKEVSMTNEKISSQHEDNKKDKGDMNVRNPLPPTDSRGPSLGNPRFTSTNSNLDSLANDTTNSPIAEGGHERKESGSSFVRTNASTGKEEKEQEAPEEMNSDSARLSVHAKDYRREKIQERDAYAFMRPKSENFSSRGNPLENNLYDKSHRQSVHYMPSASTEDFQITRIDEYSRYQEKRGSRGDRERERGRSHRPSSSQYPQHHRGVPSNGEDLILRSVHDDRRERYHRPTKTKENPSVMKHIKKGSKDLLTFLGIMTPPSSTEQERRREQHVSRSSQYISHHHRSTAIYDNGDIFDEQEKHRSSGSNSRSRSESLRPRNTHPPGQHRQRMPRKVVEKEPKHQVLKDLKKDFPDPQYSGVSSSANNKKQAHKDVKEKHVEDDLYSIDPTFGTNKAMHMDRNTDPKESQRNSNAGQNLSAFLNQDKKKKIDDTTSDQKDETDSVSSRKSIWSIFSRKSRVSKSSISKSIRSVNRIRKSFTTYKSVSTAHESQQAKLEDSFHEENIGEIESEDQTDNGQTVGGSPTKAVNASLLQGCQRLIDDESGNFLKIVISSGGTSLLVDQFMESLVSGDSFEEDDDFTEEVEIKNPKCKTLARALSIIIRRVSYSKEGRIELLKKGIMTKLFIMYKKNFKNRMLLENFLATMLSLLKDQDEALFDVELINESMQISKFAGVELDDIAVDTFSYKDNANRDQNEEDSKSRQVKKVIGAVARLQVPFNGKECLRNSLIHWNTGDTGSIMCKQVLEMMAM